MDDQTRNAMVTGGAIAVGIAVAIIIGIAVLGSGGDEDDGAAEGDLACTLATAGVGAIATGLSRGRSAGEIVATLGGPAVVGYGCGRVIRTLVREPETPVEIEIETDTGTTPVTPTGAELAAPPPEPASNGSRLLDCLGWDSAFMYQACVDGIIEPPA
jgi:hypothetical protein